MMEPVLVIPDLNREMRVKVDASDFVMGEVLLMKCDVSNYSVLRGMEAFLRRSQGSV